LIILFRYISVLFAVFGSLSLFAATDESHKEQLKNTVNELTRLNSRNIDSAVIIVEILEKELKQLKINSKEDLQLFYTLQNQMAITYAIKGDNIKSFDYFKRNTELDTALLPNKEKGTAFNNLAICYMNFGNYSEATKNYFVGLRYRELNGDLSEIAGSYLNIGLCYYRQKIWDESLKYYQLARESNAKSQNPYPAVELKTLNNIGLILLNQNKPDEALDYFKQAENIAEANNLKVELASSYIYYSEVYSKKEDVKKAIHYAKKALEINRETGSEYGANLAYINLGGLYIKIGQHSQSRQYLDSAMVFFRTQKDLFLIKDIYEFYARGYFTEGNYKMAYHYVDSLHALKDSIFSTESINQQKNTEAIYGNEKQRLQIANLEKDNQLKEIEVKRQNTLKFSFAAGFALTLILAVFIYRMYKQKHKSESILAEQKKIVEKAHLLLKEKNKEITDSITYAKRIQDAILPSDKLINEIFPQSFVLFKPKDIVSGDFYWLEKLDSTVYFAAADCTGHGVPGAMVSVVCSNALSKALLEESITQPGKILDRARELVVSRFAKSGENVRDGMDISLAALAHRAESENGERRVLLQWSGANNPLWIIANENRSDLSGFKNLTGLGGKALFEVKPNKQPIGKEDNPQPFTTHTIELEHGDTIYIFTDGYQDQFGGNKGKSGKKFKGSQLKEFLLSIQNKSMQEQKTLLNETFEQWKGDIEQVDDVCIIGVGV
jgi:serine phosphatase RsbU (regulator of sigma subunit)/Tfp pilus assembly protein PilF